MKKGRNCIVSGFSLTKDLYYRIDTMRGDVSRSKFIRILIEHALDSNDFNKPIVYKKKA